MTALPKPTWLPRSGHVWRPVPDTACRIAAPGKRCRRPYCGGPAVAEMARNRHTKGGNTVTWWAYCRPHLNDYRRWVNGGRVWIWRQVPIETITTEVT